MTIPQACMINGYHGSVGPKRTTTLLLSRGWVQGSGIGGRSFGLQFRLCRYGRGSQWAICGPPTPTSAQPNKRASVLACGRQHRKRRLLGFIRVGGNLLSFMAKTLTPEQHILVVADWDCDCETHCSYVFVPQNRKTLALDLGLRPAPKPETQDPKTGCVHD